MPCDSLCVCVCVDMMVIRINLPQTPDKSFQTVPTTTKTSQRSVSIVGN